MMNAKSWISKWKQTKRRMCRKSRQTKRIFNVASRAYIGTTRETLTFAFTPKTTLYNLHHTHTHSQFTRTRRKTRRSAPILKWRRQANQLSQPKRQVDKLGDNNVDDEKAPETTAIRKMIYNFISILIKEYDLCRQLNCINLHMLCRAWIRFGLPLHFNCSVVVFKFKLAVLACQPFETNKSSPV